MTTQTYITAFIILISSCSQADKKKIVVETTHQWSQDSIKKYFRDSIAYRMYNGQMNEGDSLNNFDKFSKYILSNIKAKNISDPFILGFDENYIDTTKIDSTKKWFRISVDPCFRIPYCFVLEQVGNKTVLILKMTDGHGGYYSGFLNFVSRQDYGDSLYSSISKKLHQVNFWQLDKDTTCGGGLDGESWTFEAIENGKYNIVTRWVPMHCGNDITKQLAQIGLQLMKKSQFIDFLKVRTGTDKKKLEKWYFDG